MDEGVNATEIAVELARENEQRKILEIAKEQGNDAVIKYLKQELDK